MWPTCGCGSYSQIAIICHRPALYAPKYSPREKFEELYEWMIKTGAPRRLVRGGLLALPNSLCLGEVIESKHDWCVRADGVPQLA
jgi:hypothetical protein